MDSASLLFTDGTILRTTPTTIAPWLGGKAYHLSLEGFRTASHAEAAGRELASAVLWTCVSLDVAARRDYQTLEPGRVFDRTRAPGFEDTGFGMLGWPTEKVAGELVRVHGTLGHVDAKIALSMENLRWCSDGVESTGSVCVDGFGARAVGCASFARWPDRRAREAGAGAVDQNDSLDGAAKLSLRGRLTQLRKESIRQALRRLVRDTLPNEPDAAEIVDRAYALRSELVHSGQTSDADLDPAKERVEIARILRKLYGRMLKLPLTKEATG